MSKAKRHDWRPGLVQHCGNVGCSWHRRNKQDIDGNATSVMEYRNPAREQHDWIRLDRVPPCGSAP